MDRAAYLKEYGVEPAEEKPAVKTGGSVEQMRERLELKKLEIEIDKLEKPDTSIDYYSKMLELQEKNFKQLLDMNTSSNELKLEIEKLKLMGDGESDSMLPYIQMLAPILPEILKSKGVKKEGAAKAAPLNNQQEEEMEVPTTAGELEEYKKAVQRGEISLEEAYKDFLTTPWAKSLTREQFEFKFNELKLEGGKTMEEEEKTPEETEKPEETEEKTESKDI